MNYQLPDKCCYWCEHCYRNDYDDIQCKRPGAPFVVDAGGCCEQFVKTMVSNIKEPDIVRRKRTFELFEELNDSKGDCISCQYSTDTDGIALCMLTGKVLTDINKGCKKYARATPEVASYIETEEPSYEYNESGFTVDTDSISSDIVAMDGQPSSTCVNCAFSALDDEQQPYCKVDNTLIEDVDGTCHNWAVEGTPIVDCICETCAHSKDPCYCTKHDRPIEPSESCDDWEIDNAERIE